MRGRPSSVTATDVALLRALASEPSVVDASRRVGITRDRANYRLARLERAFGGPVVTSVRGGRGHGTTLLTPLGDRIAHQGFDAVELLESRPLVPLAPPNLLHGVYHADPSPRVVVGPGLTLRVAFAAAEGEPVSLLLDPESVLVARRRFPSSARNVLPGIVDRVGHDPVELSTMLLVHVGTHRIRIAITMEPVRQLRLHRGSRVWLYVKATALRRVAAPGGPTRGSPRS